MRGVNKGDFSELHFSNGTYVKAYVSDKSVMLLLSHLVDISPKSHYMSNSFIRYEFDSKETALSCFKDLESGKYSSVDDALNTTYDIIMTYNGKDVERHVGTESGEDSKVRDLVDTLNTPMNMFAHINGGSLDISLLLKS